jgi:tripartite-type tricarboxylate transporter receptor subunit TctC
MAVRPLSIAIALLLALSASPLAAQSVAEFYRGKTITCYIGYGVGGGYDLFARTISRHMTRHIPGNPTILPVNMPGASSMILGNHLARRAPQDGTAFGAVNSALVFDTLFAGSESKAQFHGPELTMIGNAVSSASVLVAWHTSGVKTIDDLKQKQLIIGATSRPGDTYLLPLAVKNVLGLDNLKIITGYPGTREIGLAIDRNEVHGACGVAWPSISVTNPGWFNGGQPGRMRVIVQTHATGSPDLNQQGVPKIADFAKTDEQRVMLNLYFSQTAFGRPYLVSPDVPKERIAALRAAFEATIKDPKLQEDAKKIGIEANHVPGEKLQDMVQKLYATPPDLTAKMKAATVPKT